jgi:hypothetical protein
MCWLGSIVSGAAKDSNLPGTIRRRIRRMRSAGGPAPGHSEPQVSRSHEPPYLESSATACVPVVGNILSLKLTRVAVHFFSSSASKTRKRQARSSCFPQRRTGGGVTCTLQAAVL